SKRAKEPFVACADEKIGAKSCDVDGDCAAALADVEKKQYALLVAGFGEARNVQHGTIVEADVADGDEASARRERRDDIVDGEKLFLRCYHFDANAFALLHRQPRGVLQRKFGARSDAFVAWLPRE